MEKEHSDSSPLEQPDNSPEGIALRLAEIDFKIRQLTERIGELQRLFMWGEITDHEKNPEVEYVSQQVHSLEAERARLAGEVSSRPKSRLQRLGTYLFGKSNDSPQ